MMCIRLGNDELDSVRGLMTMTVNVIVVDALEVEVEDVSPDSLLRENLLMNEKSMAVLQAEISEMFDDVVIDLTQMFTVQDILDVVVEKEFADAA